MSNGNNNHHQSGQHNAQWYVAPPVATPMPVGDHRHLTWGANVQEHQIIIRHPEEQAQVRVGVRDEVGFVRGAIVRIYGLANGEVGVSIESDESTGERIADLMNRQLVPPILRRQMGQYMNPYPRQSHHGNW